MDEKKPAAAEPWFVKPNVDLLYYRVNRRPIGGDPTLFDPEPDLLSHLERVLSFTEPAISGRKHQRTWRLGNLEFDSNAESFTGQLGWARSGEVLSQVWDEAAHEWSDRVLPKEDSAVAPVAFTLSGRVLGILRHPSFTTETVLDTVLSQILNRGEAMDGFPLTEWSVEPLGDTGDFYSWLATVDQLLVLRMVFKRPNPDGEPEFLDLFERLDRLRAEQIKEEISARDEAEGLEKHALQNDPTTIGFLSAALQHAFGRVWARGKRNGKEVHYDQRQRVLQESLDNVGGDWETATSNVLRAVKRRGASRITNGPKAN